VALAAIAVSAPGLALIALGRDGGSNADALAVALGLGAAFTYALLITGIKAVNQDVSAFTIAFWQYVCVSVALAPFLLAGGRALPNVEEWPYVLVLGLALTGVMGAVYVWNLRHVTAQAAGLLAYLEPVSASLLAWAILGQKLSWEVAAGGAAVLAGGALVVLYEGPSSRPAEAPALVTDERPAFRMGE
jgi:drug/metabolite transporter (DMT)-like permease